MSSTKSNENGSGVNELGAFMVAGLALLAVVKLWDRKLAPWLAHYLTVTDGAVSVHAGHLTATRVPLVGVAVAVIILAMAVATAVGRVKGRAQRKERDKLTDVEQRDLPTTVHGKEKALGRTRGTGPGRLRVPPPTASLRTVRAGRFPLGRLRDLATLAPPLVQSPSETRRLQAGGGIVTDTSSAGGAVPETLSRAGRRRDRNRWRNAAAVAGWALIAVVLAGIGLRSVWVDGRLSSFGRLTSATVLDVWPGKYSDSVRVKFEASGREVTALVSGRTGAEAGQVVQVEYLPDEPGDARFAGEHDWLGMALPPLGVATAVGPLRWSLKRYWGG